MKNLIRPLVVTVVLAAATGTAPATASAAPAWGCFPINTRSITFVANTPVHSPEPAGKARVVGYLNVTRPGSWPVSWDCVSDAGNQWWGLDDSVGFGDDAYVWDGYVYR
ncbi:hypothetical protein [Streptomyces lavendofoliae]|uniref:hypothetical protein n=1 Tax=Streptomyces lavendofoliae TaxID=67314 RepID=UPI001674A6F2|nr:hypothetical protein [Streptomyces lavendofoliae]